MKNHIQGTVRGRRAAPVFRRGGSVFASNYFTALCDTVPLPVFAAPPAVPGGKLGTMPARHYGKVNSEIVLLVMLMLMLVGSLPLWPHSLTWGYGPSGGLGLVVGVVFALTLIGRS
jgi:hypothetical protein